MPSPRTIAMALSLAAALAVAAASAHAVQPLFAPGAGGFTLANGLQVVVIPDHRAPVVTHMVWYKVGAADDPPGKSGIAHFLEHLMFKGTVTNPDDNFSARVAALGGNDNAFTTADATGYHQTVARQHLGLMMALEADRMAALRLSDDTLLAEREVILEERRSRVDNNPGSQLAEAVDAALYQNSQYGTPTIGWAHEMATLDRDDARALYDRYYTPNNAIVVVAGDVSEDEVRALAETTYGKLTRRAEPPPRVRYGEPEPLAARTVSRADPRVTQPSLFRLYLAPSDTTALPGEAEALDVLADILGGSTTSRFYRGLVVDQAVATAAGVGYRSATIGDGAFSLHGVPRGATTLTDLEAAIDALIADLIADGVSDDEVAGAKRRIFAGTVYAQDNPSSLARVFGRALTLGQTIDDVQHWPERIDAVTAADVTAAARKFLDIRRSVTGYLVGAPDGSRS